MCVNVSSKKKLVFLHFCYKLPYFLILSIDLKKVLSLLKNCYEEGIVMMAMKYL